MMREFADRLNRMSPEEVALAMESLPTDVLEWAVRFEALARADEPDPKRP